jgi:hypothetical protein
MSIDQALLFSVVKTLRVKFWIQRSLRPPKRCYTSQPGLLEHNSAWSALKPISLKTFTFGILEIPPGQVVASPMPGEQLVLV